MIWIAVGGLALGLFAGPLILYAAGTVVLKLRGALTSKNVEKMQQEHNMAVEKLQKEYEKGRDKFNKKTRKIQKILAKAKGA